jgi:ATP-dependent 26S proteasome regulatory subunit
MKVTKALNILKSHKTLFLSFFSIDKISVNKTIEAISNALNLPLQRIITTPNTSITAREKGIYVVENILTFLNDLKAWEKRNLQSQLLDLVEFCRSQEGFYLILLDTERQSLPSFLDGLFPQIVLPLPQLEEIAQLIKEQGITKSDPRLCLSVSGLSIEEIRQGIKSVVLQGEDLYEGLMMYKRERLKNWGLEFMGLPEIHSFGGLDLIKEALAQVVLDYSQKAKDCNLPLPKGWLLVGPPGTGKTFAAKVCAAKLGFPLIAVGIDLVKSRGSAYLKQILQRIEAASPAVCYFDEFDKFFTASSHSGEDSQSKEVLGVLLTWLQEKVTKTFVIATLNRLDALPPELTRAGRFDKIFYVGFPQAIERKEIVQLHAVRYDRRYQEKDGPLTPREWQILLNRTSYCTGGELAWIVERAARLQFYRGIERLQLDLEDFLTARSQITPLYLRDTERILAMENRARYVAMPASSIDTSVYAPVNMTLWGEVLEQN